MKKYFNTAIILELASIAYTIIHNYYFISGQLMLVAAGLMSMSILYIYWQCFTNKELTKQQKTIGLIVASIPTLVVIGWLVFVGIILAFGVH
jgi:heme O synthase-like polyprenyltransferase